MTGGLHWIDGVIIALYGCATLALGWYFSRRQKSAEEYFVGNRAMNPLLIGVSMFVTVFSTISYLATPGELIKHGPVTILGVVSIPIVYCIVGYLMVPVYMKHRATSAYELLETHLGLGARLIGASMFVALRLVWMSLLVYFACKAMLVMLELGPGWLALVTFVTASIAICYSSLGGLRAVVITDLFQFLLLFGGALLVIGTVTLRLGDISWIPTKWNADWDTQPLFSINPAVRVTVVGSVLHGVLWWVCTAGGDQTAIQRFMATKDARDARRSFLTNAIAGASVSIVLALVGFSLLGYFQDDPGRLPPHLTIEKNADLLFPHFISHHLPIGLSGIVISGMFAAAMSSLDSGINSITAVVTTDYVDRFRKKPLPEDVRYKVARYMAIGIGLIVVSASSRMDQIPGNFLEQSQRSFGLFVTPIFTLFFLALFVRFASQTGAIAGAAGALLAGAFISFGHQLTGLTPISFQWILPSSLFTGVAVGCLFSMLFPKESNR